jgi:hypothetical protein
MLDGYVSSHRPGFLKTSRKAFSDFLAGNLEDISELVRSNRTLELLFAEYVEKGEVMIAIQAIVENRCGPSDRGRPGRGTRNPPSLASGVSW